MKVIKGEKLMGSNNINSNLNLFFTKVLDDGQKDIVDTFIYTAKGLRQSWQEE